MKRVIIVIAGLVVTAFGSNAMAGPITCGSTEREATMTDADECWTGPGNPGAGDILGYTGGSDPWTDAGEIAGGLADGFLSIEIISGGFDQGAISLMWTIADEFWEMYAEAVISIHVGNGNGDPDHFVFLLNPGDTTGTLEYARCDDDCGGGGFSNIRLWGRGEGVSVPEPGTALLLGSGLLLLAASRRRRRRI